MSLLQAIMGSMPESFGWSGGGGGYRGGNPMDDQFMEDQYRASLKQWLADNEADLVREDSRKLAEMWKGLYPAVSAAPSLDDRTKAGLLMAAQAGGAGFATENAFKTALGAFENSQDAFAKGGMPTNNIKDFQFAERNPQFSQFMQQQHPGPGLPAALQVAEALARADGRPSITREDIIQAGKLQSPELGYLQKKAEAQGGAEGAAVVNTPERAKTLATEETKGREESKAIINQIESVPKAIQGYQSMVGNIDKMLTMTDALEKATTENPGDVGGLSFILTNPRFPIANGAREWMSIRDNLRGALTLSKIQEMKQQSATGATGLGAMSEQELKAVQDSMTNLDQSNTREQILKNLGDLKTQLATMRDRTQYAHQSDYDWYMNNRDFAPRLARDIAAPGGPWQGPQAPAAQGQQPQGQQGPVQVRTVEEAMALPPGTVFITPDGRRKVR